MNSLTDRTGVTAGLIAYLWWGLVPPLYFRQLSEGDPGELLAHRIVWALVLLSAVLPFVGGLAPVRAVFRSWKLVGLMLLSATLLSVNWVLYIQATVTNHVADASLGYYMLPLVNAFFAIAFLGEKLRPAHYPALLMVALGVVVPIVWLGLVPWIGVGLAVSFGLYGLVRKLAPIDSFTGLVAETALITPVALGYIYYLSLSSRVMFGQESTTTLLLLAGGVVTVAPLLSFTVAVRRLPLLTLNLLQVISPTVQLLLAVFWNGQEVPLAMWVALTCVLLGVAIFLADSALGTRSPTVVIEPADELTEVS